MYHRIGEDNNDPDITVSPKNFERQMRYLREHVEIVSLDKILEIIKHHQSLKRDMVAITFDDGYRDNYINAYPILKKYDIPSAIFITTGFIDKDHNMLNTDEIILMQKEGNITFGAHSVTHKALSELDRNAVLLQIKGSKSALEKILQEEVKYFAYPYGKKVDFTYESMQIVKEAGYVAAFSTENGRITKDSNIFALNRLGIRNFPLFVFKVRVSGFFENNWFYFFRKQRLI
jgi:peptidoglycan/xylan/chitin deacetylase (PgdA/CDA1 family)